MSKRFQGEVEGFCGIGKRDGRGFLIFGNLGCRGKFKIELKYSFGAN